MMKFSKRIKVHIAEFTKENYTCQLEWKIATMAHTKTVAQFYKMCIASWINNVLLFLTFPGRYLGVCINWCECMDKWTCQELVYCQKFTTNLLW